MKIPKVVPAWRLQVASFLQPPLQNSSLAIRNDKDRLQIFDKFWGKWNKLKVKVVANQLTNRFNWCNVKGFLKCQCRDAKSDVSRDPDLIIFTSLRSPSEPGCVSELVCVGKTPLGEAAVLRLLPGAGSLSGSSYRWSAVLWWVTDLVFSPTSVCWSACQQDDTKTSERISTKTRMEDESRPRMDPDNFWCRSFFLQYISLSLTYLRE